MHYGMGMCGYDPCSFGYGYPATGGYGGTFTLIVVLFILLIIVGVTVC